MSAWCRVSFTLGLGSPMRHLKGACTNTCFPSIMIVVCNIKNTATGARVYLETQHGNYQRALDKRQGLITLRRNLAPPNILTQCPKDVSTMLCTKAGTPFLADLDFCSSNTWRLRHSHTWNRLNPLSRFKPQDTKRKLNNLVRAAKGHTGTIRLPLPLGIFAGVA